MLRTLVLLLALANIAFFAWSHGYLRGAGLGPDDPGEPQRLRQQIHPERVVLNPPRAPGAPTASPPKPAASTASAPPPAASIAASAAAGAGVCLQLGPYADDAAAVATALRAAGFAPRAQQQPLPAQWMVLLGPFSDTDTLKRMNAELQRIGLRAGSFGTVVDRPRYMPGLSLGVFATAQAAQQQLARLQARGVSGAHVVQRNDGMQGRYWMVDGLSPARATALRRLPAAALHHRKPQPCGG